MLKRRHFKQPQSLKDRLALFAQHARASTDELPPGPAKTTCCNARQPDRAFPIDEWANSPGLERRLNSNPGETNVRSGR